MQAKVIILDFGSQYTQLIARAVRELGVYCEMLPGNSPADRILQGKPKALIISGSPASVLSRELLVERQVLDSGLPIFSICYGMQLIAAELGGKVEGWGGNTEEDKREFGPATLEIKSATEIFDGFAPDEKLPVWMSHGDKVTAIPQGFECLATSENCEFAAVADPSRKIYGVQFHPEVHHTPSGKEILSNFLFKIAGLEKDWDCAGFIEDTVGRIKAQVPEGNVVCGLSGGVDSTVAARLVSLAIGERLHCIFVDNGLLREGEADEVMEGMLGLGLQVTKVDASERFLSELSGVTDPEQKRKIIGRVFIEVFEAEAHRIEDVQWLVQGTLYPDVIESVSVVGKSATIKSHHNVGGLTDNMKLKLIEPLRELFKDEVREIGRNLSIAERFVMRQPFPGPGLAIRVLGEITPERLKMLRKADKIVRDEVAEAGLQNEIWQYFAALLPVNSVGVMGDARTYEQIISIRAITSRDGMTADWYFFDEQVIRKISSRIVNETSGVNRVLLDVSSKPPATIEYE